MKIIALLTAIAGIAYGAAKLPNSQLSDVGNSTIKCRVSSGSGSPEDCTAGQATAIIQAFVGATPTVVGTKGAVPAPAAGDAGLGKFLHAGGTWSVVSSGVINHSALNGLTSGDDHTQYLLLSGAGRGSVQSITGSVLHNIAGNGQTPALEVRGQPFLGTATTSYPQVLFGNGNTSNSWGTVGTWLGINAANTFLGNLFDMKVNNVSVYTANYQGGLTLWNRNDNGNYLGSLTLCNGASNPASSANCVSLYQSGGGIFNISSPNATSGATTMIRTDNTTGAVGIGGAAATTSALIVQVEPFAAYNAYHTLVAKAKSSQTGDLQQWQDSNAAAVAKIDINGGASVQKINVGTFNTQGGVLAYDGTTFRGSVIAVPACVAISASAIDWSQGNCFTKSLSANTTFTFTGAQAGQTILVRIKNPATYTWLFPNQNLVGQSVLWSGSTIPSASTAGKKDLIAIFFDGTEYFGTATPSFGGF